MKTYILMWLCFGLGTLAYGQSITNIEYYFNTDPGLGNGTNINANTNTGDLTQDLTISVPTDAVGFNTLFIRTKDNNNVWSLYDKAIFFITDFNPASISDEITAAEYYFNTDPGFGNATPITLNANSGDLEQTLSLPLPTGMVGFNSIFIRVQDDFGFWSLYDAAKFYVTDFNTSGGASQITGAEYYFDTDPGFGNGTALTVNTNPGSIDQTFTIAIGAISEGFHKLYIRVQDDLNTWSLYDDKLFYVKEDQTATEIVGAEYFYDTDPGFGNGTATTITTTGNPDEFLIDLATTDVDCDFHNIYIRLQNADGTWSLYDYREDIEVFDNADPTIVVFDNIAVELDNAGQGTITIDDVNNGTFDDCELVSVVMTPATVTYDCSDIGAQTVTITATDAEDKVSTQEVTISVVEFVAPTIISQNITVQLDEFGEAIADPMDVDNGSTDNCTIASYTLSETTFYCDNLGDNTVIFTVTDTAGNISNVDVTITVEDIIPPSLTTQNITVELGADGTVTIGPFEPVADTGDNCLLDVSLENDFFTCDDVGPNEIIVYADDGSGNSTSSTAIITVVDAIDPVAVTSTTEIILELDANGMADLDANIDGGSTDNCGIAFTEVVPNIFTCDDLGVTSASFEVFDDALNMDTVGITVTVVDNLSPTAIGQDITVELVGGIVVISPEDIDNGSFDNCSFNLSIDQDTFTQSGDYFVELTATDGSGHSDSTILTVTVEDTLSNESFQLDNNSVNIYPNPVKDVLNINSKAIIDTITVFDIGGRRVLKVLNTKDQIEVSTLVNGVYFIKLSSQNRQITKRFIKQ